MSGCDSPFWVCCSKFATETKTHSCSGSVSINPTQSTYRQKYQTWPQSNPQTHLAPGPVLSSRQQKKQGSRGSDSCGLKCVCPVGKRRDDLYKTRDADLKSMTSFQLVTVLLGKTCENFFIFQTMNIRFPDRVVTVGVRNRAKTFYRKNSPLTQPRYFMSSGNK